MLPTDAKARKDIPLATGVFDYFPKALAAIAEVSRIGNEQHNPGTPLHWDRSKSGDEADALARHLLERGKLDTDGLRHSAKMAWRSLALLEKELEVAAAKVLFIMPGPPAICCDCGADLGETGHFVTCLSQAAHLRR